MSFVPVHEVDSVSITLLCESIGFNLQEAQKCLVASSVARTRRFVWLATLMGGLC